MENKCVRDAILIVINEMEQVSKELFETLFANKRLRPATGHNLELKQVADLLIAKDNQLKSYLKLAQEQEKNKIRMDSLILELNKEEEEIKSLQKSFKEAEHILATALYQAKQKLALTKKASENQVSSEELIRYAHKISASHAVAAPYNWEQGDPRRPYPTDLEMRSGLIGQINDFPLGTPLMTQYQSAYNAQSAPNSGTGSELNRPSSTASTSSNSSYVWQGDIKPTISGLSNTLTHSASLDVKSSNNRDNVEDMEVMSTDSSSSSSSDSQ